MYKSILKFEFEVTDHSISPNLLERSALRKNTDLNTTSA